MKKNELIKKTLEDLYTSNLPFLDGKTASYIPELAHADIHQFAIVVVTVDGKIFEIGDSHKKFTLQSVSKPFVYGLALETHGREKMLSKVGVEPTGDAFNSIIELEKKSHRPYNPMINSGAIAVSSLIAGKNIDERILRILNFFENFLGHPVHVDENVFESEKKTGHRNRAIANLLKHFNILDGDIEESLDLYFKQCSILADTTDLALMAATLANGGIQPITGKKVFGYDTTRDILSLMFTCGMYDSSGNWAFNVGLPAKSGISGGLIAVAPGKMGIAAYSPLIDDRGHSVRGMKVIKELAKKFDLNIFSSGIETEKKV